MKKVRILIPTLGGKQIFCCFPPSVGIKFSVFATPPQRNGHFLGPFQKSAPRARWGSKFFLLPAEGGAQNFDFFDTSRFGRPFLEPPSWNPPGTPLEQSLESPWDLLFIAVLACPEHGLESGGFRHTALLIVLY